MADRTTKTTSSTSLDKPIQMMKASQPNMPNLGEALLMTRLTENRTTDHSHTQGKQQSTRQQQQQQQKLNDLTNHITKKQNDKISLRLHKPQMSKNPSEEWQEVCSPKNKLKRKKTLSASLTSVTDSVNQEKRTRIEGMQLNCRGRLHIKENINTPAIGNLPLTPVAEKYSNQKPPLPPSSQKQNAVAETVAPKVGATPPPRLKRKLQENVQTIQKLNALTEQLRLEINELKSSLTTEKGAVRVLRAHNEAEARKWKNEVKKLQNAVELLKKTSVTKKCDTSAANHVDNMPQAAVGGLVNYEIQRLTNEINALKEANKAIEEKKVINCDADRRKAADIRELKDSYEIRLTQIQKSAKNEISRLLEEIKTKERNIGQLKKDLKILQTPKIATSRNATTNNNNKNSTNKTTTLNIQNTKNNLNNKKPKNVNSNATNKLLQLQQQTEESSKELESCQDLKDLKDSTNKAENSNEISKLKNIELINNTKNVTTNLQKSTKILNSQYTNNNNNNTNNNDNESHRNVDDLTVTTATATTTHIHKHLKALEIPHIQNDNCIKQQQQQYSSLLTTSIAAATSTLTPTSTNNGCLLQPTLKMTATPTPPKTPTTTTTNRCEITDETDHFDEQHITQELTQHLQNKAIQDAKNQNEHNHTHHHNQHNHRHHLHSSSNNNNNNNHSDSDSALSSAPTSISPQPPANGIEPTDLWQTMRSYTNDIEKLQKEVDLLQKHNDNLQQELNMAKDHIIELETNAIESSKHPKIQQYMDRIKYLEDQEHELQAEANDLREQNELLEFRILELEETNDKWSLQSHINPTSESSESLQTATATNTTQNVWSSCPAEGAANSKPDPFEMLFGSNSHTSHNTSIQLDSGIISPQSQHHPEDFIDISNGELCQRLGDILKKATLEDEEKHCLHQVLNLVQQLDALTPRSGANSLNANSSSDEANSLDLVKSRVSDYSSASSSSSARLNYDTTTATATKANCTPTSRIVATVQPYNSIPPYTPSHSQQLAPNNTPTDSPRKVRSHPWQSNSLSESGVFVESDFFSDISENSVCTQTDFEESGIAAHPTLHHIFNSPTKKLSVHQQNSTNLSDQKRLQYYKDRLEVLEGKVLIYESSGDVQAKRLAERLQREILLEKEVNELRDRVDFLESENETLEEEKCEFEEAENDTRLRLQRLEVELEILSQRNVELEMSREALSAKYKDCHSECLILRDDLATSETQIRHLEEDKQKAKENFEFLHNTLPLLLICNTYCTLAHTQNQNQSQVTTTTDKMGNQVSDMNISTSSTRFPGGGLESECLKSSDNSICHERELQYLKEEVKCLRHQIKELNSRHYSAMESADSHWVDLEREYKEREEQFRAKEMCLKQKIQKLQDCLRDDARSANEKICQLEEAEQGLKTCLVKISKDHQKLQEDHQLMQGEYDRFKEQHDQVREQQRPLLEALESEKKRNKGLIDELTFMRKLQQETENQSKKELEYVRTQMFDLKKDFLHIEVTNGELREEVATLELQIQTLEKSQRDSEEKIRCLTDEIRTKDEICQKLEKRLERSEGYSLADELGDTPSKRFKREDVKDLQTATKGLGQALRHMGEFDRMLPTQKQFKTIARDVKKLADSILHGDAAEEEVSADNLETLKKSQKSCANVEASGNNGETTIVKSENETFDPPYNSTEINEGPLASSTPIHPSLMEIIVEVPTVDLTVGMALFPQFHIDESQLPSCSHAQKKVIYEVPSELRKLSTPPQEIVPLETVQISCSQQRSQHSPPKRGYKKHGRRSVKKRMTRGRVSNLHVRVKQMVSCLNARQSDILFQDASDLDIYESEILQCNISYGSFYSVGEEAIESIKESQVPAAGVDACTECEIKIDTKDTGTEAHVSKEDSCVQVYDEVVVAKQMESIPMEIRCFLSTLQASASRSKLLLDSCVFNMKICQLWQSNVEFRQGLEILAAFSSFKPDDLENVSSQNNEDFVNAMSCLHILENMFKPNKLPVLMQIEEQINERIMSFHKRKVESQFYCTVYYPVKRESAMDITNFLIR